MHIRRLYGIEGARAATGITIIIDIFRAANVEAYALGREVDKILPVATIEEALFLKKENLKHILVGEVFGKKPKGFDFNNSPFELSKINLKGKTIIHRSSQGTQGLVNAIHSDEIIFGSFVVSSAIVKYLKKQHSSFISIVAMDGEGSEDEIFAEYIEEKIKGGNPQIEPIVNFLKNHPRSADMLDPNKPEYPEEDFYLCLKVDVFDFVPIATKIDGILTVRKQII